MRTLAERIQWLTEVRFDGNQSALSRAAGLTPNAEVGQGDLLANVSLFEISADGRPAAIAKATHALIVSRDCAVENKPQVLVAAVFANPLQFAKEEDPKKRFEACREGLTARSTR